MQPILLIALALLLAVTAAAQEFVGPTPKKQRYPNGDALLQVLRNDPRLLAGSRRDGVMYFSIGEQTRNLRLYYGAGKCLIELVVFERRLARISRKSTYMSAPGLDEPTDLPVRFALPEERLAAFRSWLGERNLTHKVLPGGLAHGEKLEGYDRRMMITVHGERDEVVSIIEHIITVVLADAQKPFTLEG